ncbi:MAG: DNA-3-methyladenine glycosylase I [Candidatus Dojkabacteria bacterium]
MKKLNETHPLIPSEEGNRSRCFWVQNSFDEMIKYHDTEWGVPIHDDKIHFEFLILEGAQAGLSWSTILKRREGYRKAFANFDVSKVAKYDVSKFQELLLNPEIIRNKLKIRSEINNAKLFLEIQNEYGSFSKYIWSFVNNKPIINHWKTPKEIPANSKESDALSKDLIKRGFKFVGSTIMYAHMQATGLVMDHTEDCFRFQELS